MKLTFEVHGFSSSFLLLSCLPRIDNLVCEAGCQGVHILQLLSVDQFLRETEGCIVTF